MSEIRLPKLSKSKFVAGLQCLKRLWLTCYRPDEAPEPDVATQARFKVGHEVGSLARQTVPGGVLVTEDHTRHADARRVTQELMANPAVPAIYEAAFTFDDIRIRADILQRLPDGAWRLIEVKSSTEVKECHLYDVAIQKYVLEGCGLKVASACLMHLNNQYVYDGKRLDLDKLFVVNDVTDEIAALRDRLPGLLAAQREALRLPEPPNIEPDRHCHTPYTCEWWDICRRAKPESWTLELYRLRDDAFQQLRAMGIEQITDIPDSFPLNAIQRRVRKCIRSGEMFVSADLGTVFGSLVPPVRYLDFETFMPALPRYRGTRPFQTLPTQWSLHLRGEGDSVQHLEWLCDGDRDPRREFAESLIAAVGTTGSIVVYSHFEKTRLNELAHSLPDHAVELRAIQTRLWDLLPVVRGHVYHPAFRNSFSLKTVLPAVVPGMTYSGLAIHDGSEAETAYLELIDAGTAPERKAEIRQQLLDYCEQDTLAMVRLHEKCIELGSHSIGSS